MIDFVITDLIEGYLRDGPTKGVWGVIRYLILTSLFGFIALGLWYWIMA